MWMGHERGYNWGGIGEQEDMMHACSGSGLLLFLPGFAFAFTLAFAVTILTRLIAVWPDLKNEFAAAGVAHSISAPIHTQPRSRSQSVCRAAETVGF